MAVWQSPSEDAQVSTMRRCPSSPKVLGAIGEIRRRRALRDQITAVDCLSCEYHRSAQHRRQHPLTRPPQLPRLGSKGGGAGPVAQMFFGLHWTTLFFGEE